MDRDHAVLSGKLMWAAALLQGGALLTGDPAIVQLILPLAVMLIAFAVTVFLFWVLVPWWREHTIGEGRHEEWGFQGFVLRGDIDDDGRLWISVTDCERASGLPLESRLRVLSSREKYRHRRFGWMTDRAGMLRVLADDGLDPLQRQRLALFLARNVWREAAQESG